MNNMKKQLILNLKKKWFDMILSGEKKTEYREIKESTVSLLFNWRESGLSREEFVNACKRNEEFVWTYLKHHPDATIEFHNGYKAIHDRPIISFYWEGIEINTGIKEWGAEEGVKYFCLEIGGWIYSINAQTP